MKRFLALLPFGRSSFVLASSVLATELVVLPESAAKNAPSLAQDAKLAASLVNLAILAASLVNLRPTWCISGSSLSAA